MCIQAAPPPTVIRSAAEDLQSGAQLQQRCQMEALSHGSLTGLGFEYESTRECQKLDDLHMDSIPGYFLQGLRLRKAAAVSSL